ncbi:MAG TPA: crosslink repair DNA glycosylase YcaQ family protein [Ktedonobacterales bacterium]|nr:crosslink repair DNA glycosylase YcaQ family protein [Ktedonobacterales bacterium]
MAQRKQTSERTNEHMAALHLSIEEARALTLAAQGLLDPPPANPTRADVLGMIERLGVVQIDTINVVRRSQYLVLWSRLGAYDEALFDNLLYPERAIFEYWCHAASILPMSDYPLYRTMMDGTDRLLYDDYRHWADEHPEIVAKTVNAIRERGPLASADFERPNDGRRAKAWDWYGLKETRVALEVLWTLGDLMVHSRRGAQKVYALREHVEREMGELGLNGHLNGHAAPDEERIAYFTRRTIEALGVVPPSWLFDYFRMVWPRDITRGGNARARRLLEAQVTAGHAVRVEIEGIREPTYLSTARLPDLERLRAGMRPQRTTLLSPFDNLIWDRSRARARVLFGFEVLLETYVVPEKRRYGYYTLAILHQGRLVGRLDPKMDRDTHTLMVRALFLEPGEKVDAALVDGIAGALRDLGRFLGAETITVERSEPAKLAERLQRKVLTRTQKASARQRTDERQAEA